MDRGLLRRNGLNLQKPSKKFVIGRVKKRLTGEDLLAALEDACRGLTYISETDSKVVPLLIAKENADSLAETLKKLGDRPVEEKRPEAFFERLTRDQEWHTEADRNKVRRFRKLEKLILENLDSVRLVKAGRIRVEIFIVGRDEAGNIAGIRTAAVET
jgi:hypothetical protein